MAGMEDQGREMREAFAAQMHAQEAQRQQLEALMAMVTMQREAGTGLEQ